MALNLRELVELKREEIIGLDIGSSQIKAVHLRKDNGAYIATAAARTEIGATIEDSERQRIAKTVAAIRVCVDAVGLGLRQVVCGISGPEIAVRPFAFPALPSDEVPKAVMLEAEQVCPFDTHHNIVDYQLVASDQLDVSSQIRGVMVGATNEVVRNKLQLVNGAYLNCALMDVDGLALANCYTETMPTVTDKPVAILNVGNRYTNIVILKHETMPFVRDIARGSGEIVDTLAIEKSLSRLAVLQILSGIDGKRRDEVIASLPAAAARLIADINETLRFYLIEQRMPMIERLYVCGGFAIAKGFIEALESQLHYKPVVWNPFDTIRFEGDENTRQMLEKSGPAMAVATGLAMRCL